MWRRSSTRQLKGPAIEYTLDLGNHNLNGPIPENLADLAQLQCLVLSHNNLSGSIPSKSSLSFSQFGDSLKLQGLYLGKNQLSGTIPERLGRLSSLVKLNFTSNKLYRSGSSSKEQQWLVAFPIDLSRGWDVKEGFLV
ncbi:hypothetical protein E3N88_22492 [Mikania micrantha]|uniref:Leucine-rich repeat-containing N-terminal plant-type domain-containing protein n=1 Tax=Mikania micrantha TaxID=192012 RepID=A0A5N6NAL7_9ASTR|nr:hypothetical protein E3N88_22492 [Mikania micrantha]